VVPTVRQNRHFQKRTDGVRGGGEKKTPPPELEKRSQPVLNYLRKRVEKRRIKETPKGKKHRTDLVPKSLSVQVAPT